jgi:hypothetical protein
MLLCVLTVAHRVFIYCVCRVSLLGWVGLGLVGRAPLPPHPGWSRVSKTLDRFVVRYSTECWAHLLHRLHAASILIVLRRACCVSVAVSVACQHIVEGLPVSQPSLWDCCL